MAGLAFVLTPGNFTSRGCCPVRTVFIQPQVQTTTFCLYSVHKLLPTSASLPYIKICKCTTPPTRMCPPPQRQHPLQAYTHPTLLPTQLNPPSAAVTPVNTINPPYPVPYPNAASPRHGLELNSTSLSGPQATAPMPLPALNMPKISPDSLPGSLLLTSARTPVYVDE